MSIFRSLWAIWKKVGQAIGDVIGRLILSLIFITILLPIGLAARLFADPLKLKTHRSGSYWFARTTRDKTLEDSFRQF